ncbi:Alanine-tRNA ligase [Smittium mucronatum]|uniref:Alanine--tRNA ligase n=1 Tax=Smittium mucronatum TaxID=133383 RepID=A0A1R0H4S7_9FUNG|nr:Alanine-tRNA ligase [Smittium mucronatum]
MVPFKNYFLSPDSAPQKRVTTIQQCIRAGGKHNDLDDVGRSPRHHTFFEMLGNFSFNSYGKKKAIQLAWQFLTKELELPISRLRVSVLIGDKEAQDIWENVIGLDPSRILQLPESENFWSMGTNEGPCGSCTEIFWNMQKKDLPPDHEDQWIELWNVVFMNQQLNSDKSITPLKTTCIDTGMGLERLSSVLQGVPTNFDTDEFVYLIKGIKKTLESTGASHRIKEFDSSKVLEHYRIIADHIRSCSLLISQGVYPSNTGRGYVLRRIIRRAIRSAYQLGASAGLLASIYPYVESTLGKVYDSLVTNSLTITNTLNSEESLFYLTFEKSISLLEKEMNSTTKKELSSDFIFELYDTHGLPPDLAHIIVSERGLSFNMKGIVINPCPFYGFGGGQPNDKGSVSPKDNPQLQYCVENVISVSGDLNVLVLKPDFGTIEADKYPNKIKVGDTLLCNVDSIERRLVSTHHTATHLLQAALRKILGHHVVQSGSSISADRFRFDFSNPSKLTDSQIQSVENLVNEWAVEDFPISTHLTTIENAKNRDKALGEFSTKYEKLSQVRVVSVINDATVPALELEGKNLEKSKGTDKISTELCAGTHLESTFGVYPFMIISESSTGSGTRRIEAMAGVSAIRHLKESNYVLKEIGKIITAFNKKKGAIDIKNGRKILYPESSSDSANHKNSYGNGSDQLYQVYEDVTKSLKSKQDSDTTTQRILLMNARIVQDSQVFDQFETLDLGLVLGKSSSSIKISTQIHIMPSINNQNLSDKSSLDRDSNPLPNWAYERASFLSNKNPNKVIITVQEDNIVVSVGKDVLVNGMNEPKFAFARDLAKRIFMLIGGKGGGNSSVAKGKLSSPIEANDKESIDRFLSGLSKIIY